MTTEMTPRDDCSFAKSIKVLLHTSWIGLNEFGDDNGADGADDGAHTLLLLLDYLAMIMKTSAND